ncbi:hypothetical protein [Bacillus sp. CECT 9360]|uniref:hypothetical protein n=1 Tax=Bacillus sp. CECT 9360 TaxID=2845821 RepID=UPI001E5EB71D|nr:hypothetical protein [Bacillus sp. CECT 9360]CAH0344936.1 hypothetical protein BCI9360_01210 [Bacillus sp. CECT 9360]
MSISRHYDMCCRHVGRAVEIRTHDGRKHRGIIDRVSHNRVYLRPIGGKRNYGGFGYGGWGYGGAGVAIAAIAAIAVIGVLW